MRLGVFLQQVVTVISRNQRQVEFAGKTNQLGVDLSLLGQTLVLQLHVYVAVPKDFYQLTQSCSGALVISAQQVLRNFSRKAGARRNETFSMFSKDLLINPWLVIETLQVTNR